MKYNENIVYRVISTFVNELVNMFKHSFCPMKYMKALNKFTYSNIHTYKQVLYLTPIAVIIENTYSNVLVFGLRIK
jgi:hypothetical protein